MGASTTQPLSFSVSQDLTCLVLRADMKMGGLWMGRWTGRYLDGECQMQVPLSLVLMPKTDHLSDMSVLFFLPVVFLPTVKIENRIIFLRVCYISPMKYSVSCS